MYFVGFVFTTVVDTLPACTPSTYVIAYSTTFHVAVNVLSPIVPFEIVFPSVQAIKSYPVLVGFARVISSSTVYFVGFVFTTVVDALPACTPSTYVIVYSTTSHVASNVKSPVVPLATVFPGFHPLNVYPFLVASSSSNVGVSTVYVTIVSFGFVTSGDALVPVKSTPLYSIL